MIASLMQSAEHREYRGPAGIPDSTTRPYAFSEEVPLDKVWVILAASARDFNQTGSAAIWLYAVPPPASDVAAGNAVYFPILRSPLFTGKIANQLNAPPLVAGVQVSRGGPSIGTKEMLSGEAGSGQGSVNFLSAQGRPVILPPRWMLTVMQDGNAGGGSNMLVTLSLMILPLPVQPGQAPPEKIVFRNNIVRSFMVGSL